MPIHRTIAPLALLAVALTTLIGLSCHRALAEARPSPRPWLFFDMGDTLVRTVVDPATRDVVSVRWMRFVDEDGRVTDSRAYLLKMKAKGYPIGLISNIPQTWADPDLVRAKSWLAETDPSRRQALFAALIQAKLSVFGEFFEGRGPGDGPAHKRRWSDTTYPAMDWGLFDSRFALVPFFDEYRKPDKGPVANEDQLFLFQQAMRIAARSRTRVIYQADNRWEIEAARKVGLIAHLVPLRPDDAVQPKGYFLSEAEIDRRLAR